MAVADTELKIARLDELWHDCRAAYDARARALSTCLPLAERFWAESGEVMRLLKAGQTAAAEEATAGVEPTALAAQRSRLEHVRAELAASRPRFDALRDTAAELLALVGADERVHVEQQLLAMDQEWALLSAAYDARAGHAANAEDKSSQFFTVNTTKIFQAS